VPKAVSHGDSARFRQLGGTRDRAVEDPSSSDRRVERDRDGGVVFGWMVVQALVRSVPVEVGDVFVEDLSGVALVVDQHPVCALVADGAYEPFDVAVRPWRPRRAASPATTSRSS
jgi:hypothetical protein